MKVEVAVLGPPSLTNHMVFVDVKHYERRSNISEIRVLDKLDGRSFAAKSICLDDINHL